jgi:pimeloyl-ACP methyl ester carboxylesterase
LRGKELNTQAAKARPLARVLDRIDPLANSPPRDEWQAGISSGNPDDLKKITVPVLVMHGDDDQIVLYADAGARCFNLSPAQRT